VPPCHSGAEMHHLPPTHLSTTSEVKLPQRASDFGNDCSSNGRTNNMLLGTSRFVIDEQNGSRLRKVASPTANVHAMGDDEVRVKATWLEGPPTHALQLLNLGCQLCLPWAEQKCTFNGCSDGTRAALVPVRVPVHVRLRCGYGCMGVSVCGLCVYVCVCMCVRACVPVCAYVCVGVGGGAVTV
jgi:hypothetical protein